MPFKVAVICECIARVSRKSQTCSEGVACGKVTDRRVSQRKQVCIHHTAGFESYVAVPIFRRNGQYFGNICGLDTVLTGPEIHVLPGRADGPRVARFEALDSAPVGLETPGLKVILRAERPRSIRPNTPIHYRGVEVGMVQKVELGPNSISADVHALIFERYAGLVRQGSAFWDTSGVNVKASLLKGIDIDIESLRAIATGGIEFATPSEKAPRVKAGTVFFLHDKPKEEWLSWLPRIPIPAE